MFYIAPWYYRDLLLPNDIIKKLEFYDVELFDQINYFECNAYINPDLKPNWVSQSKIYTNCEGTGTDKFKNVAVYKAISELLERYAFYFHLDQNEKTFKFDLDPTTTGMAAYPHFLKSIVRKFAKLEAIERWAIHEFNRGNLPIKIHLNLYKNVTTYELLVPYAEVKICILYTCENGLHTYAFAGAENLNKAVKKALIELNRNRTVLKRAQNNQNLEYVESVDKTLFYFASDCGFEKFKDLVKKASNRIVNTNPKVICDKELVGPWTKYAKVWRYLLEDSYFDTSTDHTFFMF